MFETSQNGRVESSNSFLPPSPPNYHSNKNAEIQSSNNGVIPNTSDGTSSSSITSDPYKESHKHSLENSQGLDVIGSQCDESLDKNDTEPTCITLATFDNTLTTTTAPTVEHENQLETISSSSNKRKRSISQPNSSHQTTQRFTTHENLTNDSLEYTIISVSLLNPLASEIDMRTDRDTELKDCFGDKLVLIVRGSIPDDVELELAMTGVTRKGFYNSLYRFHDLDSININKFTNKLRRKVILEKRENGIYLIKLDRLFVRKERTANREIQNEKGKFYKLIYYPLDNEEFVKAKGPMIFADRYKLNQPQLAIRFFSNNSTTPIQINGTENQSVFFSNVLSGVRALSKQSNDRYAEVNIKNITSGGQVISFDNNNQCIIEFEIKFPKEFSDKIDSYCKWLEISLSNKKFNGIYYISTSDGYTTSTYMKIKDASPRLQLVIVKKTSTEIQQNPNSLQALHAVKQQYFNKAADVLSDKDVNSIIMAIGLNRFVVQFRLLPGITMIDGEKALNYSGASILHAEQFTELSEGSLSTGVQQTILDDSEQNSTNTDLNGSCDYLCGLSVTRATTQPTENDA